MAMPISRRAGVYSREVSPKVSRRQRRVRSAKITKRETGIWQRRYWEHGIRDDADSERHIDYIHYNPVKHGLATQVRNWPHSSFHRYVEQDISPADWDGNALDMPGRFGE